MNKYKQYWNIIVKELNPEEWRYEYARRKDYRMAVFGFRSIDNPDANDLNKGKAEYEWEQKVWKVIKDI